MENNDTPLKNKHVDKFIPRFESFLNGAKGTNRGEIQNWLSEDNKVIKRGYLALKKEQEICTIMHPQATQKLNSFFYIPKIRISKGDENIFPIDLLTNDRTTARLILGRLGQGKSMFFRYLQFLALNCGDTIPIFLELRRIKNGNNIEDAAFNKLKELGFDCSKKLFNHLLMNSHLTLFLDGYDEIPFRDRATFDTSITNILNKTAGNKVFISSRFNNDVEKLSGLRKYEIQPLNEEDHPKFIRKLLKNDTENDAILKKIDEAKEFDSTVLDTPLLLTWFIMVYKVRKKIPKTKIGFYEELFRTILSRHDGIKGSFDRPSKSGLTDSEIELVLHAFCYITSKYEEKYFEYSSIIARIQQAINITKLPVDADDYLYDLTNITCLIIQDGLSYNFIHSTIQKYFSACFIKDTNEQNAKQFYETADTNWSKWEDELGFLHALDSYRFHKFMVLPSIATLTKQSEETIQNNKGIVTLSEDSIKTVYSESCLLFSVEKGMDPTYLSTVYIPTHSYTCYLIFNNANYKVCKSDFIIDKYVRSLIKKKKIPSHFVYGEVQKDARDDERKRSSVNLIKTLNASSHIHNFCEAVKEESIDMINQTLRNSLKTITAEEAKQELF